MTTQENMANIITLRMERAWRMKTTKAQELIAFGRRIRGNLRQIAVTAPSRWMLVWTAAAAGSRAEPVALATVTEMFFILSAAGSVMKTFLVLFAAPSMMAA